MYFTKIGKKCFEIKQDKNWKWKHFSWKWQNFYFWTKIIRKTIPTFLAPKCCKLQNFSQKWENLAKIWFLCPNSLFLNKNKINWFWKFFTKENDQIIAKMTKFGSVFTKNGKIWILFCPKSLLFYFKIFDKKNIENYQMLVRNGKILVNFDQKWAI